jgi:hypothetical protein
MTLIKLGFDRDNAKHRLGDLAAGAIAGGAASIAVAPLDAVKDTMKMNQTANRNAQTAIASGAKNPATFHKAPTKMWEVTKDIWKNEKGTKNKLMGFYRGAGTGVLKIAPMAALQFMLYGLAKDTIQRKNK